MNKFEKNTTAVLLAGVTAFAPTSALAANHDHDDIPTPVAEGPTFDPTEKFGLPYANFGRIACHSGNVKFGYDDGQAPKDNVMVKSTRVYLHNPTEENVKFMIVNRTQAVPGASVLRQRNIEKVKADTDDNDPEIIKVHQLAGLKGKAGITIKRQLDDGSYITIVRTGLTKISRDCPQK